MKSNWAAKTSTVDDIKIFDINDKATKHSFSIKMFSGLTIITRCFNPLNMQAPDNWFKTICLIIVTARKPALNSSTTVGLGHSI